MLLFLLLLSLAAVSWAIGYLLGRERERSLWKKWSHEQLQKRLYVAKVISKSSSAQSPRHKTALKLVHSQPSHSTESVPCYRSKASYDCNGPR